MVIPNPNTVKVFSIRQYEIIQKI